MTNEVKDQDQDTALVNRAKQGDQRAFEVLVVKYQRRIERLVGRMIKDSAQIQDVTQETFIRAYKALPNFRGESAFYTWLYRIAMNTAKRALADIYREPAYLGTQQNFAEDEDETSDADLDQSHVETPEALLAGRQVAATVNAAIDGLSEELRQAITLREIEGMSYEDIAELMDCPIGTVRSRIFRARETIANRLRPLLQTKGNQRW